MLTARIRRITIALDSILKMALVSPLTSLNNLADCLFSLGRRLDSHLIWGTTKSFLVPAFYFSNRKKYLEGRFESGEKNSCSLNHSFTKTDSMTRIFGRTRQKTCSTRRETSNRLDAPRNAVGFSYRETVVIISLSPSLPLSPASFRAWWTG